MFIYNITTKVNHSILEEWMQWQKHIHIPEIIATGLFYDHRFYELLEQDEEEGRTFVIQFLAHSKEDYKKYLHDFAPSLRKESEKKWADNAISFRSLLKNVS